MIIECWTCQREVTGSNSPRLDSWKQQSYQLSASCNSPLHCIALIFVLFLIKLIALNTHLGRKPYTHKLCMGNMTAVDWALEHRVTTTIDSWLVHFQSHLLIIDVVLFPLALLQQVNDLTLLTQDSSAEQLWEPVVHSSTSERTKTIQKNHFLIKKRVQIGWLRIFIGTYAKTRMQLFMFL